MKQKMCTKHNYKILCYDVDVEEFVRYSLSAKTPQKAKFTISNKDEIKKVMWSFGGKPKPKRSKEIEFNLKKHMDDTSYMVCATAFDSNNYYVTQSYALTALKYEDKNYINPTVLKNQIMDYYSADTDDIPDEIAISLQKIANRLAFASNFINYTYNDEMAGDALLRMLMALKNKKFDPDKGNPFSYFTMIAYTSFCNRIKIEKRLEKTHDTYRERTYEIMISEGSIPYTKLNSDDNSYNDWN